MDLASFDIESLVKLLIAGVLGAAIGLERGTHGRPAGLRTHALVCIASTLLIVVSRTGALVGLEGPSDFMINVDPSRMAAGIVTGIGFLGAGAILRVGGDLVRGLTTAACIWFVAAIGVAVGMGAYLLAGGSTLLAVGILTLLTRLEGSLGSVAYRTLVLDVASIRLEPLEQKCRELIKSHKMRIQQIDYAVDNKEAKTILTFSVRIKVRPLDGEVIRELSSLDGVSQVKWY